MGKIIGAIKTEIKNEETSSISKTMLNLLKTMANA